MAKDDVPPLGPVPRKRRALEAALDVHVAMWLAGDDLTPSERRRVADEKQRRRDLARTGPAVVLGFSGSREGMTPAQRDRVRSVLEDLRPAEVHHGDCVGADATFHALAKAAGARTVAHPSTLAATRAYCDADVVEAPKPPLERNKDIVRASTLVVATPKERQQPADPRGQGTWSTVRYARQRGGSVRVITPLGEEQ